MLGNDSGLGSVVGLRQGEQAAQTVKSISDVTFSKYSGLSTTLMLVKYGPEALFDEDLSTVGENVLILLQRPTAPGMVSETDYHLYKTIEKTVSKGFPLRIHVANKSCLFHWQSTINTVCISIPSCFFGKISRFSFP